MLKGIEVCMFVHYTKDLCFQKPFLCFKICGFFCVVSFLCSAYSPLVVMVLKVVCSLIFTVVLKRV